MKHIMNLVVLSLLAPAFARPPGFCTANAGSDKTPDPSAELAALKEQLAASEAENAKLRAAQGGNVTPAEEPHGTTALLMKGAGVDPDDVHWRVRAGLSPAQAVEVAALEKAEREAAKKKEAKK